MRSLIAVCVAAILAAGCTTTSTVRLAADRAIITTRGNAFTTPEKVQRDLLVQAASEAQARGYEWFLVENATDVSQSGVLVNPARGSAQASGNAAGWQGSANYTGASYTPYVKPGMQVVVRFGSGPKPEPAFVAAEVLALNAKD